ncbi:hypothetical protein Trydic_g1702 [Trypoxylus dichotomus]
MLTEAERRQIDTLNNENYSIREIARRLTRSDYVIRNYLRDKENYGQKCKGRAANYSNSIEFSGDSTSNSGCCRNFRIRMDNAKSFETISTHSSVETEKEWF